MDYDGSSQRNNRDDKRDRDRGKDKDRERDRDRRRDDSRRSSHKYDDYEDDRDEKRRRRGVQADTEERAAKVSSRTPEGHNLAPFDRSSLRRNLVRLPMMQGSRRGRSNKYRCK
jgi:hypothetical protein